VKYELWIFLRQNRGKEFTANQLSKRLRVNPPKIRRALFGLYDKKILKRTEFRDGLGHHCYKYKYNMRRK